VLRAILAETEPLPQEPVPGPRPSVLIAAGCVLLLLGVAVWLWADDDARAALTGLWRSLRLP